MSSADTLRAAAQLLRERAEAVPDWLAAAPRVVTADEEAAETLAWDDTHDGEATTTCDSCVTAALPHPALAGWLALMHPAVGPALAAWLDTQAVAADWSTRLGLPDGSQTLGAFGVARAVLQQHAHATTGGTP